MSEIYFLSMLTYQGLTFAFYDHPCHVHVTLGGAVGLTLD